ncbi:shikimate O-hydroxycinnamoyltransferase-like [Mercurialis annua]|uniref:shikimate O-hydroxycinnamoyltransferase-like n=1 Tax=Mercurialis annua TaxID=3986 RepID=UPI0024AF89F7|nr:shikimate O-hydroxycinnamoyltransferase-like [Mercurialis annua]
MKIKIINSTMIRAAQETPSQFLWLSNLDLLHEKNNVPTVYLYNKSTNFDAKVLKDAMSKVLVQFYPVAGRLGRDENGRLEINCNNEGVMFIEAETNSTIDDLGDLMLNLKIPQLIPTVDYSTGISSFLLFVVQVTKFTCGGVSLGIRFHHVLGDGTAALNFINTWCDAARGLPIGVPLIDRTVLRSQYRPNPKFQHTEFGKPLALNNSSTENPKLQSNSIEILKFTPDQLNTLKNKVNNNNGTTRYSSYETLTAHIWRCTSKARSLANDQPTKLYISVDGRSRLDPKLPRNYFGNVSFPTTAIALCEELLSESLQDTAERIRKSVKKMDDEYLRSAIDFLGVLDDLTPVMRGPDACRCPNLHIISWMWLPFYEADFGMGKPIYVRPANPLEGKGYVIPTPGDDNNWALSICLEQDHMHSFKKLFYDF